MAESEVEVFYKEMKLEFDKFVDATDKIERFAVLAKITSKAMAKANTLNHSNNLQKKAFVIEALGFGIDKVDIPIIEGQTEATVKGGLKLALPTLIDLLWVYGEKDVLSFFK